MSGLQTEHEHWGSRFAFLMAAVGSSVGLGNFWRFPYTAGSNGGSLFILVYLACIVLVAFPVLVGEYAIGRRGQHSAVRSVRDVARESGASGLWSALGWVGMIGAFLILSFYAMIAGWVVIYVFKAFSGAFVGANAEAVGAQFGAVFETGKGFGLPDEPLKLWGVPAVLLAHTAFMAVNVAIVARGVNKGIAWASKILMPAFFVMLIGILIFGVIIGDFGASLRYLFVPDLGTLYAWTPVGDFTAADVKAACEATPLAAEFVSVCAQSERVFSFARLGAIFSEALGQAFFSVGVGVGLMITYGSYLSRDVNITNSSVTVAAADTFVALIAGLVIFPLAFGFGQAADAGPGLFFVTLPNAFAAMPPVLGVVLGGAFFTLALFAAITSSISLLEVSVAWLEEKLNNRVMATVILGGAAWLVGLGSLYSLYIFDFIDQLTSKVLLPLGGFLVAVFAGWVVTRAVMRDELDATGEAAFGLWRSVTRWVAPIGAGSILAVSIYSLITNPPVLITSLF